MPSGSRGIELEFDFHEHVLHLRTTDGEIRQVALEPRTVADFYAETMGRLTELRVPVKIIARPTEVADAIPFEVDDVHNSYDPIYVSRFWQTLVQAERVFTAFRTGFVGKSSPVHFYWGAFDLAGGRFSGREAPAHPGGVPNSPDFVQRIAYTHEVSAYGYWPGGDDEGIFYAYAYPEPAGYASTRIQLSTSRYDVTLGEFILPYRAVRSASNPVAFLMSFLEATYEAAAGLGGWDRAVLEPRRGCEWP